MVFMYAITYIDSSFDVYYFHKLENFEFIKRFGTLNFSLL